MRAVGILCLVAGCSGSSFDISPSLDDSALDSASVDAAPPDSGADVPTDSAPDTTPASDSEGDTRAPDAMADATSTCPAPRSTKSHEVTTTNCTMLREQYGKAVNGAKVCNCDAECTDKLDSTLCSCETYANPARDEYLLALAIEDKFRMLGCVPTCGPLCKAPVAAKCVPFGAVKVCADQF